MERVESTKRARTVRPSVFDELWSVEEDQLILKAQEEATKISTAYSACRKDDPKNFRKQSTSGALFRSRMDSLSQLVHRPSVLKRSIQQGQKLGSESNRKGSSAEKLSAQYKKAQHEYKKNVKAFGTDKLEIRIATAVNPPATITTLKKPVLDQSNFFKKRLEHDHSSESGAVPVVQITDTDPEFEGIQFFECFSEANFQRFLLFSRHPDCRAKEQELVASEDKLTQEHMAERKALEMELEAERLKALDKLRQTKELDELEREYRLQKKFEEEIQVFRQIHEKAVKEEMEHLTHLYDHEEDEVAAFFDEERSKIVDICDQLQEQERVELHRQCVDARDTVRRIFVPRAVPLLCLLAEALEAENLRNECIAVMSTNLSLYGDRPELTSIRMEHTVQQLLSLLPVDAVYDLSRSPGKGMPSHLIERELGLRRRIVATEYASCCKAELLEALRKCDRAYADTINAELARRQNPRALMQLGPTSNPHAIVEPNGLTVSSAMPLRYVTAWADTSISLYEPARFYFEVTINSLNHSCGASASVGVDVQRSDKSSTSVIRPGITPGDHKFFGCALQHDGNVHWHGESRFLGLSYTEGDVIGCCIDTFSRSASFYKRGVKARIPDHDHPAICSGDLPFALDVRDVVPTACLYSIKNDQHPTKVTFNFTGPFKSFFGEVPIDADACGGFGLDQPPLLNVHGDIPRKLAKSPTHVANPGATPYNASVVVSRAGSRRPSLQQQRAKSGAAN